MPGPYWQVTGASDIPAMALFRQLRANGFSVTLFEGDDKFIRVMAGPYVEAESLEDAKSKLENAGFHPLRIW